MGTSCLSGISCWITYPVKSNFQERRLSLDHRSWVWSVMLRRYSRGSRGGSTELNQKAESGGCWYSAHTLFIQSRIPAQGMVLLTVSHRVYQSRQASQAWPGAISQVIHVGNGDKPLHCLRGKTNIKTKPLKTSLHFGLHRASL